MDFEDKGIKLEDIKFCIPEDFKDIVEFPLEDLATEICKRVHEVLIQKGITQFVKENHLDAEMNFKERVRARVDRYLSCGRNKRRRK